MNTNYHTQLATYIKNNMPSWMKPRFEGPNETWNLNLTNNANYANNISQILWGTWLTKAIGVSSTDLFYNRYIATMGAAVSAVYGGNTANYSILAGIMSSQYSVAASGIFDQRLANNFQLGGVYVGPVANGTHPTCTSLIPHGFTTGQAVALVSDQQAISWPYHWGGNVAPPFVAFNTYYVTNNGSFSTTTFDLSDTLAHANAGTGVVTTTGTGAYNHWAIPTGAAMGCTYATTIACTSYWSPYSSWNSVNEAIYAIRLASNLGPTDATTIANANTYVSVGQNITSTQFTGYIDNGSGGAGTVLHVVSVVNSGGLASGGYAGGLPYPILTVGGSPLTYNTSISAQTGGTTGGIGTYTINNAQLVGSSGSPVTFTQEVFMNSLVAWAAYGAGLPVPVNKLCAYEGGYSADQYNTNGQFSGWYHSVATMTAAANAVITVGSTLASFNVSGNPSGTAFPVQAGNWIYLILDGIAAPWNGVYTQVISVVGGNITVGLNTTSMGSTYTGSPSTTQFRYVNEAGSQFSDTLINHWRMFSKTAPILQSLTNRQYLDMYATQGGEFPSCFILSYPSGSPPASGNNWGVFDPDIYATPSPQWAAIVAFN